MKKLLIFDLDGTLADTLGTIHSAVNMCLEHFSFPSKSFEEVRVAVGNGTRSLMKQLLPEEASSDSERFEEIMEYFSSCYWQTCDQIDGCYDGVYEAVLRFGEMGHSLAVLSNKPDPLVKKIMIKLFPENTFIVSLGQTEMPRKPDPTVPLLIASKAGVAPSDTYFIGDSEVDVLTAKNSGMNAVAVSWGFRERDLLESTEPLVIVDSADELLRFFEAI